MRRITFLQPQGDLTEALVDDALGLVGCRLVRSSVGRADLELLVAYDWAMREHLSASDNRIRRRKKPSIVERVK